MSRAKPVSERNALDFYATPQALADAICGSLAEDWDFDTIVEPSAGHGPFVRAARRSWPEADIIAVDCAVERISATEAAGANATVISDWLRFGPLPRRPDSRVLVVGNPPFRDAEAHIRHALDIMEAGDVLAFLLRLNLLGSRSRLDLWASTSLSEVIPVVPRPSFTGGGSDATEYAVFVWIKGEESASRLALPLVWNKPRRDAAPREVA